jgi:hypothetical protein
MNHDHMISCVAAQQFSLWKALLFNKLKLATDSHTKMSVISALYRSFMRLEKALTDPFQALVRA